MEENVRPSATDSRGRDGVHRVCSRGARNVRHQFPAGEVLNVHGVSGTRLRSSQCSGSPLRTRTQTLQWKPSKKGFGAQLNLIQKLFYVSLEQIPFSLRVGYPLRNSTRPYPETLRFCFLTPSAFSPIMRNVPPSGVRGRDARGAGTRWAAAHTRASLPSACGRGGPGGRSGGEWTTCSVQKCLCIALPAA